MTREFFIGLMSGTSADGIDAVLVSYEGEKGKLLHTHHAEMPSPMREAIIDLRYSGEDELHRMAELDQQLAMTYARAVSTLLTEAGVNAEDIAAIGSHGQTIRHDPEGTTPFTW